MKPFEHAGKKYTNADSWRSAKAMRGPQAGPMPASEQESTHKASPVGGGGAATMAPEDDGTDQQDGEEIAAEHGPAVEVHVQHEHEIGAHHVHSIHPDGHEHHSDHGSANEAHMHAAKVAGAHEEPDGDEESGEGPREWED